MEITKFKFLRSSWACMCVGTGIVWEEEQMGKCVGKFYTNFLSDFSISLELLNASQKKVKCLRKEDFQQQAEESGHFLLRANIFQHRFYNQIRTCRECEGKEL